MKPRLRKSMAEWRSGLELATESEVAAEQLVEEVWIVAVLKLFLAAMAV